MQAVLLALVALATTGAHAKCPSNIDAVTASVTQVFNGQRSPYDWTFSPTALSSLSPKGAVSCGPSHIAQYSNGNCDANCNRQMSAPVSSTDKCEYAFTDGGDRVMNLKLSCDAGARALSIDPEVPVAQGMMGYTYDFTGKYAGVCEGGETTPTTTTAAPTTKVPEPPAEDKTTHTLLCVAIAIGVVGVLLGAISVCLQIARCLRKSEGSSANDGYAMNTNGAGSALIGKDSYF